MSDEKSKVLEMLAAGKITVKDAERLLAALGESNDDILGEAIDQQADREPEGSEDLEEKIDRDVEEAKKLMESVGKVMDHAAEKILEKTDEAMNSALSGVGKSLESMGAAMDRFLDGRKPKSDVPDLTLYPDGMMDEAVDAVSEAVDAVTLEVNTELESPEAAQEPEPVKQPEEELSAESYSTSYVGDSLTSLGIHWVAGAVEIVPCAGSQVKITEYSKHPLKENERMSVSARGGKIEVHWLAGLRNNIFRSGLHMSLLGKRLVVEIPESVTVLEELEVHSASGTVSIADLPCTVDDLSVETASGKVTLENLHGDDVSVHTASGAITAEHISCDEAGFSGASGAVRLEDIRADEVDVKTASGAVTAENVQCSELSLETVSGAVTCTNAAGEEVDLKTVSGAVLAGLTGKELQASSVSGALRLTMAELPEEVSLKTFSGRIELSLPDSEKGFSVAYNTRSGVFRSDFPLDGSQGGKKGRARYGNGGAEIDMTSTSGGLWVRKTER